MLGQNIFLSVAKHMYKSSVCIYIYIYHDRPAFTSNVDRQLRSEKQHRESYSVVCQSRSSLSRCVRLLESNNRGYGTAATTWAPRQCGWTPRASWWVSTPLEVPVPVCLAGEHDGNGPSVLEVLNTEDEWSDRNIMTQIKCYSGSATGKPSTSKI